MARREQFGHFLVSLWAAVTIKLPDVAHFANHVHVQVGDDQRIFLARALLDDLAPRIGEVALPVKFTEVPGFLGADAIDRADVENIGNSRGGLFEFPQVFAEAGHRGAGIENDLGAVETKQAPAFGEMAVVTNIDADLADGGLEDG